MARFGAYLFFAGGSLALVATATFTRDDRTLLGDAPETIARTLAELGVDAIGVNCGEGPAQHRKVRGRARHADPRIAGLEELQVRLVAMRQTRVTEGDQRVGGNGHGAAQAGHHDSRHAFPEVRATRGGSRREPARGRR